MTLNDKRSQSAMTRRDSCIALVCVAVAQTNDSILLANSGVNHTYQMLTISNADKRVRLLHNVWREILQINLKTLQINHQLRDAEATMFCVTKVWRN